MTQQSLFHIHQEDLADPIAPPVAHPMAKAEQPTGEQLKREGIARAAAAKQPAVAIAREIACDVARGVLPHADGAYRADGLCTMDDVMHCWPEDAESPGNAAGVVFQNGNWEWTGQLVKSLRPHAHSNLLRVWKRKHD